MDNLEAKLDEILKRLSALEKQVSDLDQRVPVADEDTIMAITAAVAAYLGVKAKVRAIHYQTPSNRWAVQGRRAVHRHEVK